MVLATRFKNDLMLLISPSTSTLTERLGGLSLSLFIIGKFAEALIPIDTGSGEDELHRLDLVLAPTNYEELSGRKLLEFTNPNFKIKKRRIEFGGI